MKLLDCPTPFGGVVTINPLMIATMYENLDGDTVIDFSGVEDTLTVSMSVALLKIRIKEMFT